MAAETKKFRSRLHLQREDPFDVEVGDYVEYTSEDRTSQFRVGRVAKLIYKGRGKKKYLEAVQTEAHKYAGYVVRKAEKVNILRCTVWTKKPTGGVKIKGWPSPDELNHAAE